MPRGVYDRSALKAKRAAEKSPSPVASIQAAKAPIAKKTFKKAVAKSTGSAGGAVSYSGPEVKKASLSETYGGAIPPHALYQHLASVTAARVQINSQQAGHNEKLLDVVDGELSGTITSLRIWREANFPTTTPAEETPEPVAAAPVAPVAQPAPIPVPPAPVQVTPPLPFTPATAQEVMKSAVQQ